MHAFKFHKWRFFTLSHKHSLAEIFDWFVKFCKLIYEFEAANVHLYKYLSSVLMAKKERKKKEQKNEIATTNQLKQQQQQQ